MKANQFRNPCGLAIGPDENLFVSDFNNHRVVVLSTNGEYIQHFGSKGSGVEELDKPQGIAISGDELYICDSYNYRIKIVKATDGSFIRQIGSQGTSWGQFDNRPIRVAVTSDSRVLVKVLKQKQLSMYDKGGKFLGLFPQNIPSSLASALANDVSVDANDNVFVPYVTGQLAVYDKSGALLTAFGSKGQDPDQFQMACGVAISSEAGVMVVCDKKRNRLLKFNFDANKS